MTLKEILDEIEARWTASERYELVKKFKNAPEGAATGGEGMGMIMAFFQMVKNNEIEAYNEVDDLIGRFILKVNEENKQSYILR